MDQPAPRHRMRHSIADDQDDDPAGDRADAVPDVERGHDGVEYNDDNGAVHDEVLPFLVRDGPSVPGDDGDATAPSATTSAGPRIPGAAWYQAQRPGSVLALTAVLLFFMLFATTLVLVPMLRLLEDAICQQYYRREGGLGGRGGTDERLCKVDAVQAELAWLGGVGSVTQGVFGVSGLPSSSSSCFSLS